jgi:hypothetical protein
MLRIITVLGVVLLVCGCSCLSGSPSSEPFTLSITPSSIDANPGQQCVFLVSAPNVPGGTGDEAVEITATCPGATVAIEHSPVHQGESAEVTVIPGSERPASAPPTGGWTLTVKIRGDRAGWSYSWDVPILVNPTS